VSEIVAQRGEKRTVKESCCGDQNEKGIERQRQQKIVKDYQRCNLMDVIKGWGRQEVPCIDTGWSQTNLFLLSSTRLPGFKRNKS
jgi:hypothetical protein